jgi:HD-GYP domain-containing protein (c-di-GMP phosphodiesterase class II)
MKIRLERQLLKSLALMAAIVEARDPYTGGHLWRVGQYSGMLAEKLGFSAAEAYHVRLGGFLHDLGKIGIPDTVLGKRGPLTTAEYATVKTHPGIGEELVREHPLGLLACDTIRHHHEWYDGSGYPDGLADQGIALNARIVSVADAFDAMTSTRPYRSGMPAEKAVADLQPFRGRQFEGKLLDLLTELAENGAMVSIVGHSDIETPLVHCPNCGPVLNVTRFAADGDIIHCRICKNALRLHREGQTFRAVPTGRTATAEQIQPRADMASLNDFVNQAPRSLKI